MMKRTGVMILAGLLLCSQPLLAAEQRLSTGHGSSDESGTGYHSTTTTSISPNADVIVDMPPEVWTQGQNNNQPPCQTCCTYQNRSYTEGSVVKMEGVLLQCARDEKSYGTNTLIWKTIK